MRRNASAGHVLRSQFAVGAAVWILTLQACQSAEPASQHDRPYLAISVASIVVPKSGPRLTANFVNKGDVRASHLSVGLLVIDGRSDAQPTVASVVDLSKMGPEPGSTVRWASLPLSESLADDDLVVRAVYDVESASGRLFVQTWFYRLKGPISDRAVSMLSAADSTPVAKIVAGLPPGYFLSASEAR